MVHVKMLRLRGRAWRIVARTRPSADRNARLFPIVWAGPRNAALAVEVLFMSTSYIPSRDSELDTWLLNFSSLIAGSPTTYGLVTGDATAITAAYAAWHAAYLAATNPSTRTQGSVMTKNEQKANVSGVVRGYAATIRCNRAVSDELKIGLGLHVRDAQPTPVPVPASVPVLAVVGMRQGLQEVRVTDEATPSRRARPAGSAGMLLFRIVADEAVTDPEQARFLAFTGRTSFECLYGPADNGKTATYFARWTNAKGEVGPWSQPMPVSIAA
jgi:hypothetical protein